MFKVLSLIVICGFKASFSCGGFTFDVFNVKNCGGPDQIIKMLNRSFIINEKCEIYSRSCSVIKPYRTAMMETVIMDGPLTVSNLRTDICKSQIANELLRSHIYGFGIPSSCPMNISQTFCYKGNKLMTFSPNIRRMFSLFSVSKSAKMKITIVHDTGASCFEAEASIAKS